MLTACSKEKINEAGTTGSGSTGALAEPGYGSSNKPFTAANWQLPSNIVLEDSIHDYSYCWAFAPYTQVAPKDWKGLPFGFAFCITLRNTKTNGPVIIPFPPQLVFQSSSQLYQNVLCINIGAITLAAGETRTIVAQGYCINKGRHVPQTFDEATGDFLGYSFGPSTIPAPLQELADILQSKHITMATVLKADGTIDNTKIAKYTVIQKAIWEITDGEGLSANTKAELLAL